LRLERRSLDEGERGDDEGRDERLRKGRKEVRLKG